MGYIWLAEKECKAHSVTYTLNAELGNGSTDVVFLPSPFSQPLFLYPSAPLWQAALFSQRETCTHTWIGTCTHTHAQTNTLRIYHRQKEILQMKSWTGLQAQSSVFHLISGMWSVMLNSHLYQSIRSDTDMEPRRWKMYFWILKSLQYTCLLWSPLGMNTISLSLHENHVNFV